MNWLNDLERTRVGVYQFHGFLRFWFFLAMYKFTCRKSWIITQRNGWWSSVLFILSLPLSLRYTFWTSFFQKQSVVGVYLLRECAATFCVLAKDGKMITPIQSKYTVSVVWVRWHRLHQGDRRQLFLIKQV